jgi:hypothetical protein
MEIRQIINQFVSKVSQAAESVVEFTSALKQKVSLVAIAVIASLQEKYNNSYASSLLGRVTVNKDSKEVPGPKVKEASKIENERLRKNEELRVAMIVPRKFDSETVLLDDLKDQPKRVVNLIRKELIPQLIKYAELAGIQFDRDAVDLFSVLSPVVSDHIKNHPTNRFDQ